MVRTIVIPKNTHIEFDIAEEYVGRKLEITLVALDEITYIKPVKDNDDGSAV